jgi:hypothetical protein
MNQKRLAVKRAELWVKSANTPRTVKFLKAVPGFFFAAKTFGHGTVGGITHAGMNIFRPSAWHTYWPFFFKQFKYAFGKTADYEKAMADHVRDKDYTMWKRAGLAVDPTKVYEEYGDLGKYFGKIGLAGERGFNALKVYRLAEAKRIYNGLSATEKADPQTVKEIAKIVNHSTGTTEVKVPSGFNVAFFAPKLEVSRWQRLIQEPVKAAHTFANWKNADVSDKVAAKIVARHAGEMLATYMGALAANAALLSLSGSKQKINIAHPMDNDWMKFKAGGKTIDVSGGMLSTSRFIATLINEARVAYHGDKTQKQSPTDKLKSTVWNQMRFKASPFMGTVLDGITGVDAMGRPLPFSKVKPKKGEKAYTVGSYLLEQQTPIPVAEAIKTVAESMKEKRMSTPSIIQILNGVTAGAISGGTGAHVIPDFKLAKKK